MNTPRFFDLAKKKVGALHVMGLALVLFSGLLFMERVKGSNEKPKTKIKVLLIDGQNNHDWKGCSPVMMDTLEVTGRFSVERATVTTKANITNFNPDFTNYDVVLSNYNGESWTEKTKTAFDKYIREGGNLVVVHAADNSFPNWKEFN